MPDILIRDIPEAVAKKLTARAALDGAKDRQVWLREQIIKLATEPEIKERYAYRVFGMTGRGNIKRYSDDINGTSATCSAFTRAEREVFDRAEALMRRNALGDREKALHLLYEKFGEDNVFEVPV